MPRAVPRSSISVKGDVLKFRYMIFNQTDRPVKDPLSSSGAIYYPKKGVLRYLTPERKRVLEALGCEVFIPEQRKK